MPWVCKELEATDSEEDLPTVRVRHTCIYRVGVTIKEYNNSCNKYYDLIGHSEVSIYHRYL